VQVHDAPPDQFPANHDVGMYEIKATVVPRRPGERLFRLLLRRGLSGQQERLTLTAKPGRSRECTACTPSRCQPDFPLQIFAIWKLQGLTTKEKVVPAAGAR